MKQWLANTFSRLLRATITVSLPQPPGIFLKVLIPLSQKCATKWKKESCLSRLIFYFVDKTSSKFIPSIRLWLPVVWASREEILALSRKVEVEFSENSQCSVEPTSLETSFSMTWMHVLITDFLKQGSALSIKDLPWLRIYISLEPCNYKYHVFGLLFSCLCFSTVGNKGFFVSYETDTLVLTLAIYLP